ncbi:MAG: PBP1A family penicillin-binding protein [bacterium]|nr:PBP1A family penicillin-binding protein [bacterium]
MPMSENDEKKPRFDKWAKPLTFCLWAIVAGCVIGGVGGWITAQFLHVPQVDSLSGFRPASTTRIFTADGNQIASYALERRIELRPEQIPNHLKLAIVAMEDAEFYKHAGVDPKAILRAAFYSVLDRKIGSRGGASTLTQQLALSLFLEREHTLWRKAKEALLALDLEKRFSKDQIITMYANQIFLGHDAYGFEAASRLYFDKPAIDLTVAEAALLAGMIPSPNNRFNPIRRPESSLERRNKVLVKMRELDFIDEETLSEALATPLGVALHRKRAESGAYYLEMVRQDIEEKYGSDSLYTAGLEVHLTLDPQLQRMMENSLREGLVRLDMGLGYRKPANVVREALAESAEAYNHPSWHQMDIKPGAMEYAVVTSVDRTTANLLIGDWVGTLDQSDVKWTGATRVSRALEVGDRVLVRLPDPLPEDTSKPFDLELLQEPDLEGAMIAMDNRSGAILALVGGFDFGRSEFNRAIQSKLQCGSAFKPFVYLTAFQQGFTPADLIFDAPILLPDAEGELTYCPKNYYDKYYGITTVRRGLEASYNATAVKLQHLVGGESVVDTARRFGISTPLHPYASLALGSLEVKLIDLVRAYAGFANLGEIPEPYFIKEIYDRDGRTKERFFPRVDRAAPPSVTYLLTHALSGVVRPGGTASMAASLDANMAGKTGTTDDYTDAWFIGFTPRVTVGVWVGRNLKEPIGKKMSGAVTALPIWIRFMEQYLETLTEEQRAEDFSIPPGVVFTPVDKFTGMRAIPSCPSVVLEAFLDGTEPSESCNDSLHGRHEIPWPFQKAFYTPHAGEPMPTQEAVKVASDRILGIDVDEEEGENDSEAVEEATNGG